MYVITKALAASLAYSQMMNNQVCVHCQQPIPKLSDCNDKNKPIVSGINTEGITFAHASCYYTHQADDAWKEQHPEAKPE